jgi:anti-sigma factor RsiW
MACNELVEAVTAYLEDTLPQRDRDRFEAHVAECSACREYLAQMRETIDRLGSLDHSILSRDARAGLLAAFRDWRG